MLFGSFIMAVIHFIKIILEYLRQMKSDNGIMNCLALIAICIINCCQAFWDMLSTNAYYIIAMFGLPFCQALSLGMELTSLGVTTLFYVVGNMMVNVGVFLVTISATIVTFAISDYGLEDDEKRRVGYLIVVIIAFMISSVIMTVYSVSIIIN